MVLAPWWSLLATAVGAGLLLLIPGTLLARSWRLPLHLCFALSTGVTCAILGAVSVLAPRVHLSWNLFTVLALLSALVAINALAARRYAPGVQPGDAATPVGYLVALSVGVCATTLLAFTLGGAHPNLPAQAWDALFHQNAIVEIARSQNADPQTALSALYLGRTVTYPTLWDGILALFPTGAALAYNASFITVTVLFAISSWSWFRLVCSAPLLVTGAAWLAASLVSFTTLTTLAATAPYAASLTAVIGTSSGVYSLIFQRSQLAAIRKPTVVITGVAGCGAAFIHPSAAFSLLVVCAPALGWAAWHTVPRWWARERLRLMAVSAAILVGTAGCVWALRDKLAVVFAYQRAGGNISTALKDFPLDRSSLVTHPAAISSLAVVGIAIVGVALMYLRWRALRTPLASALLTAAISAWILDMLAAGPDWFGRVLAGPWYTQRARITPLIWIAALCFVVALTARLLAERKPAPHWRRGAIIAVVVLGLATVPARATLVSHTYDPQKISYGTMLTRAQLDSIKQLDAAFTSPTRVLVNPAAGGGYLYALSDHLDPVFKQLGTIGPPSLQPLSNPQNFPISQVCEALTAAQVTHYLRWAGDEVDNAHFGAKHVAAFENLDRLPAVLGDFLSAPNTIAGWQVYRVECETPAQ